MRRSILAAILFVIGGGVVAGCGANTQTKINREVTITNYLEAEGFNPNITHPLLSLEKIRGEQGSSTGSLSGAFNWFLIGATGNIKANSSSSLEPGTSLDFALITAHHQVGILEVPYSKIEFSLDPHAATPKARFIYNQLILYEDNERESLWSVGSILEKEEQEEEQEDGLQSEKNKTINEMTEMSISQMIVSHLRNVTITMTGATFSQDVLPLIHQLPELQTKTKR